MNIRAFAFVLATALLFPNAGIGEGKENESARPAPVRAKDPAQEIVYENALRSLVLMGALVEDLKALGVDPEMKDLFNLTEEEKLLAIAGSSSLGGGISAAIGAIYSIVADGTESSDFPYTKSAVPTLLAGFLLMGADSYTTQKLQTLEAADINAAIRARLSVKDALSTKRIEQLFNLTPEKAQSFREALINEFIKAATTEKIKENFTTPQVSMQRALKETEAKIPTLLRKIGVPRSEIRAYVRMQSALSQAGVAKQKIDMSQEDVLRLLVKTARKLAEDKSLPADIRERAKNIEEKGRAALDEAAALED